MPINVLGWKRKKRMAGEYSAPHTFADSWVHSNIQIHVEDEKELHEHERVYN